MISIISGLQACLLGLGLLSIPALLEAPMPMTAQCSGLGLANDKNWISCNAGGTCDAGTCKVGSGTDAEGAYKFCGCGANNPTEPECCHLVARMDGDNAFLDTRGLCTTNNPKCANTDGLTCQLIDSQPVCATPDADG